MLSRTVRDLRPFFRLFDETFSRSPLFRGPLNARSPFEHPLVMAGFGLRPAVDVTDKGENYVLEAELPGVKKEDVEVSIGDNGTSVIIEGKYSRLSKPQEQSTSTVISTERDVSEDASFIRTISLPHRVDEHGVSAKLADGILTVTIPKLSFEESGRVKIDID